MAKLIAFMNVVAWSGFWAFGYLAVSAGQDAGGETVIAILLAATGGAAGLWAYVWLAHHSEAIGYAKPRNRVVIQEEETA